MNKKIILVILVFSLLLAGCKNSKIAKDEDVIKYIEKYFDDKVSIVSILDDTNDNNRKIYTLKSKKGFEFNVENGLNKKGITKYYKTDYIEKLFNKNNDTKAKLFTRFSKLRINNTYGKKEIKLITTLRIYNFDNIDNLNNFLYEYYDFLKNLGFKYQKNKSMLETKVLLNGKDYITINTNEILNNEKSIHLGLLKNKYIEDLDNETIEVTKKVKKNILKKNKHTHINTIVINKKEITDNIDFTYSPYTKNYIFKIDKDIIVNILKNLKIDYSNKNNTIKYNIGTNNYEINFDKEKISFKLNNKDMKIKKAKYPSYIISNKNYYIKLEDLISILEKEYEIKDDKITIK